MISLIDLIGWFGGLLILIAYFMLTYKKLHGHNRLYHILNFFGGIFLTINAYFYRSSPLIGLNAFWTFIAIYGIIKSMEMGSKKK